MAHQGVFYDDYYAGLAFLEDEANGGDAALDAAAILLARRGVLVRDLIEREQHDRHPTRVEAYVEEIVPMYNDNEFKSHFRMKRETFERLQELLAPHLLSRQVTPEKKLLASLWLLGNKESFRGVADRFNFNKGFLHGIFFEVCSALEAVQMDNRGFEKESRTIPDEGIYPTIPPSQDEYMPHEADCPCVESQTECSCGKAKPDTAKVELQAWVKPKGWMLLGLGLALVAWCTIYFTLSALQML